MKLDLERMGLGLDRARVDGARKVTAAKREHDPEDSVFAQALARAEHLTQRSDQAGEDLLSGRIEIHEAMVRMEKADLVLQLGTTVRNKLLDAYQRLMTSAGG